ncbi:MAG: hypothetical protein VW547_02025 [Alphaproteobacteria bacterium]
METTITTPEASFGHRCGFVIINFSPNGDRSVILASSICQICPNPSGMGFEVYGNGLEDPIATVGVGDINSFIDAVIEAIEHGNDAADARSVDLVHALKDVCKELSLLKSELAGVTEEIRALPVGLP